jgi:hypothetical protein
MNELFCRQRIIPYGALRSFRQGSASEIKKYIIFLQIFTTDEHRIKNLFILEQSIADGLKDEYQQINGL